MEMSVEIEIEDLWVSDYFPSIPNTYREYRIMDEEGNCAKRSKQTTLDNRDRIMNHSRVDEYTIEENIILFPDDDPVTVNKEIKYEVSKSSIVRTLSVCSLFGANHQPTFLLKNAKRWRADEDAIRELTGTGMQVETEAGVFQHCLEVTETTEKIVVKKYYAPHIGLVLALLKTAQDEYIIFEELVECHIPQNPFVN